MLCLTDALLQTPQLDFSALPVLASAQQIRVRVCDKCFAEQLPARLVLSIERMSEHTLSFP